MVRPDREGGRSAAASRTISSAPAQTAAKKETIDPGPVGLVIEGFHIPAAKDKDIYAIQVAALLLGSGDLSRLKQRLEHEDPRKRRCDSHSRPAWRRSCARSRGSP